MRTLHRRLVLWDAPTLMGMAELVQEGQAALGRTDWARARSCFEHALEQGLPSPEALDGLGRALRFQGEYGRAIELTERAFAAYLRAGRGVEAADRARWLAFLHGAVNANMSVAGGWMARAESVLEGVEECAAHGWLHLDRAPFTEELREREQLARQSPKPAGGAAWFAGGARARRRPAPPPMGVSPLRVVGSPPSEEPFLQAFLQLDRQDFNLRPRGS